MCANCVAQGVVYVGGAVAGLQVMAARARHRRTDPSGVTTPAGAPVPAPVAAPVAAPTAEPPPDPT